VDYAAVALIGALVGLGELVSRYRDAPGRALRNNAAVLYVGVNAAAAIAALGLTQAFGWTFGADGGAELRWTRVLVAGFGAMAIFRSALFVVRAGEQDVGVGPSGFLQVVLTAADRAVDRNRAGARAGEVSRAMAGVSFEKASEALPSYCLALMQNASEDEKVALANQVRLLRDSTMEDRAKSLALGLALMNVVGRGVLEAAVASLREEIHVGNGAAPPRRVRVPGGDGRARSA
jgi:4-amino-4-deoxy-L-arabinose transferase-like glycosyltransferase